MSAAAPGEDPRTGARDLPPVSRTLLFPGPMAPLSHFGATLLRHVVASGLRYALYQLGLPPPEKPPVRIHRLRLYLDGPALEQWLAGHPGGAEVARALVDPGGVALDRHAPRETGPAEGAAGPRQGRGPRPGGARRVAGAAAFHRLRLRLTRPFRGPARAPDAGRATWADFRDALSRRLPALHDAFLGELLASLERRRRRARGRPAPPCLGGEAWHWRTGKPARLDRLGPPDPLVASWAAAAPSPEALLASGPPPPRDRHRGRFRERYRATLDALRPALLAIAKRARARGLLESPDDAFFLPFDLGDDLELETAPSWLGPAVATNRREHAALLEAPCPPEILGEELAALGGGDRKAWEGQPVAPLP